MSKAEERARNVWKAMKLRCLNHSSISYPYYGGRGIKICESWLNYDNFRRDMGERPEGMSLDRIDSDGDYCKENCRWATPKQQANNRKRRITTCKKRLHELTPENTFYRTTKSGLVYKRCKACHDANIARSQAAQRLREQKDNKWRIYNRADGALLWDRKYKREIDALAAIRMKNLSRATWEPRIEDIK